MRVISGKYGSRPLHSLRGMNIRPTSDRLREALFNVLTAGNPDALEGTVWIDWYAGSGAVGIEALSRGASQVYFVESSAAGVELIRRNLNNLGVESGFTVLRDDLARAVWRMERQHVAADVVFLDHPYKMREAYSATLRALADSKLVFVLMILVPQRSTLFPYTPRIPPWRAARPQSTRPRP